MKEIDLHIHTDFSDGQFSPAKIIDMALERKIKAIAITDHDSVGGIKKAVDYGKGKQIEVIPGIEIGCDEEKFGFFDIHILGLFIDYNSKAMKKFIRAIGNNRLIHKKPSIKEAIEVIKKSKGIPFLAHPAVFRKDDSLKLIEIFKEKGGEGIETYYPYYLIYPQLKMSKAENKGLINYYKKITKRNNLLESGGSDFHGAIRPVSVGEMQVPYRLLRKIRG